VYKKKIIFKKYGSISVKYRIGRHDDCQWTVFGRKTRCRLQSGRNVVFVPLGVLIWNESITMKPLHGLYAFFFPSTVNWSSSINSQIFLVHNNNQITVKNVIKKVVLWLKKIYVGSWCYIVYAWVEGKYTRNTIIFFCIHHFTVVRILKWRIVPFSLVYILYYSLADSLYYLYIYISVFTIFKQYFVISPYVLL